MIKLKSVINMKQANKIEKTNAIRFLEQKKINFETYTYPHTDEAVSGEVVAELINKDPKIVFKTLVGVGNSKTNYVFVIPVLKNLDLKKVSKLTNEKNISLIPVKELLTLTGYVRGGCSPIGMKKQFKTFFHESCLNYEKIIFSGGKIGLQVEINPTDVIKLINARTENIIE